MITYTNPGKITFDGVILQSVDVPNSSAFIDYPFSVKEQFGTEGRVPVNVTFDGVPYTGSLVKMGPGSHSVLIQKDIRTRIGKERGDMVAVTIELDTSTRIVNVPDDVSIAVAKDPQASETWEKLSYSHRKEYVRWIEEAKRQETRATRIEKMIGMLRDGTKQAR